MWLGWWALPGVCVLPVLADLRAEYMKVTDLQYLLSKSGGVNRAYAYADGTACAVAAAVLLLEHWTDEWLGIGDWMSIYRGSYQHLHHIVLIEE